MCIRDRLSDERVLVFGGNDAERTFRKAHVLDLCAMAWSHPEETSGPAPPARTGHAAVCLDGVRVLVLGGWDYAAEGSSEEYVYLDDGLFLLDTETWTWSKPRVRGALPSARVGHSLVPLGDSLYCFGGRGEGGTALDDLHQLRLAL